MEELSYLIILIGHASGKSSALFDWLRSTHLHQLCVTPHHFLAILAPLSFSQLPEVSRLYWCSSVST